ncbi:MAG: flavodoxin family protein [Megasphaera sp.]|jgi:flavodoxin|nr:flavodoxin family protein [Megasphaera sp.]MCH4217670.1 flavodoxin family protein [Megasphaera sp.]
MKYIVLYSSQTGLTKKIAHAIASVLPKETPCLPILQMPSDIASYDCLFLGCWMRADEPDKVAEAVLRRIQNGHVALFVSLHGDLFSDETSKRLHNVIEELPRGTVVDGTFITSIEDDFIPDDRNLEFARTFAENTMDRLER